jgi:lipopolysaccharide export system protein LptA
MRLRSIVSLVALATACGPAALRAQAQSCELLSVPVPREANRVLTPRGEVIYISGPARFRCTGGIEIRSDSAVLDRAAGELRLVGQAHYRDPEKSLAGDWMTYLGREGRVLARGNVVLTDLRDGSVVTGSELEHLREGTGRPESVTNIFGRPRAVLRPRSEAAPPDTAPPFEVVADRLLLRGESSFRGDGSVEITRGGTRGFGRSAEYRRLEDHLVLEGAARIEGDEFQLFGERIEGFLQEETLREVIAEREASLLARELRVDAPYIRIFLVAGDFERLVARGVVSTRARAATDDFRLVADSIDARADGELLSLIIAVGDAYGERLLEAADAALPALIARDWLRGDTITGHFVEVEPAENGARREAVLDRLVSQAGTGPASSMYRLRDDEAPGGPPQVNYLLASTITLFMRDGEIRQVRAEGPIRGVHLQPQRRTAAAEEPEAEP